MEQRKRNGIVRDGIKEWLSTLTWCLLGCALALVETPVCPFTLYEDTYELKDEQGEGEGEEEEEKAGVC
jgi:hypothetical protein